MRKRRSKQSAFTNHLSVAVAVALLLRVTLITLHFASQPHAVDAKTGRFSHIHFKATESAHAHNDCRHHAHHRQKHHAINAFLPEDAPQKRSERAAVTKPLGFISELHDCSFNFYLHQSVRQSLLPSTLAGGQTLALDPTLCNRSFTPSQRWRYHLAPMNSPPA